MASFGLVIKYDKSEIFYFSRVHNDFNSKPDLLAIGAARPKIYSSLKLNKFHDFAPKIRTKIESLAK